MSVLPVVRERLVAAAPRPGTAWFAGAFLAIVALAVVWPAALAPGDPLYVDVGNAFASPSVTHLFGTDQLGRDVYTRVVHGARLALLIGLGATVLAVVVGVTLGLLAGLANRVIDTALSRVFDLLGAFPEILLALVLITFTGAGTWNLVISIGIAAAPRFARVMRAETKLVRRSEFVAQAGLLTRSRTRIVLRHIVPNALGSLPVLITLGLGTSILGAAALSFLGFGAQPPTPEWGSNLAEARDDLRIAWWAVAFPGLAITATVIATTAVGRVAQRRFERRVER